MNINLTKACFGGFKCCLFIFGWSALGPKTGLFLQNTFCERRARGHL